MREVWFLIALFLLIVNSNAIDICENFLLNPTGKNYIKCKESILTFSNSEITIISDNEKFRSFISLLKKKNKYAAKLGMILFRKADGAVAEELAIYLGTFANHNPELLLNLFIEEKYSYKDIEFILLILGDKYVDNFMMQRDEIISRIKSLKSVKDKRLLNIKLQCIKILEKEKQELERHIHEEKKVKTDYKEKTF